MLCMTVDPDSELFLLLHEVRLHLPHCYTPNPIDEGACDPLHLTTADQHPCAGLRVSDFPDGEPLFAADGATVTVIDSSFDGNSEAASHRPRAIIGAYIRNSASLRQPSLIFLQQCSFYNNSAEYEVLKDPEHYDYSPSKSFAVIYSDYFTFKMLEISNPSQSYPNKFPEPLSAVPADRIRINCSSAWLQRVQQVRSCSEPSPTNIISGECS
jgi:hypothetical protein